MLYHTLHALDTISLELDWNAFFESFAVHARNLYRFLTNDDKPNYHANDFAVGFKATKTDTTKSTFEKLNQQVLHFGKWRPADNSKKANVADAEFVARWIEQNLRAFQAALDPNYQAAWNSSSVGALKVESHKAPTTIGSSQTTTHSTATILSIGPTVLSPISP